MKSERKIIFETEYPEASEAIIGMFYLRSKKD